MNVFLVYYLINKYFKNTEPLRRRRDHKSTQTDAGNYEELGRLLIDSAPDPDIVWSYMASLK